MAAFHFLSLLDCFLLGRSSYSLGEYIEIVRKDQESIPCSEADQKNHPKAVVTALKFYAQSMKQQEKVRNLVLILHVFRSI